MHPDGKTVELNRNINGVETALTEKERFRLVLTMPLTRG